MFLATSLLTERSLTTFHALSSLQSSADTRTPTMVRQYIPFAVCCVALLCLPYASSHVVLPSNDMDGRAVWRSKFYEPDGRVIDKVIVDDASVTIDDVTPLTCAMRCTAQILCGFFFYNARSRTCKLWTNIKNTSLQHGPGYKLYTLNTNSASSAADDANLCNIQTATPRGCWKAENTGYHLTEMSIGPAGVFGKVPNGRTFYRPGSYQDPKAFGANWLRIPYIWRQADVGTDILLLVGWNQAELWLHTGISHSYPVNVSWISTQSYVNVHWASVSPRGSVWVVNTTGHLLHARDLATSLSADTIWDELAIDMRQVDAGKAGVWALDNNGHLYYRRGTYGDEDSSTGGAGEDWLVMEDQPDVFDCISSGTYVIVAVTNAGHIWIRAGLGTDTPSGLAWVRYPGIMKQLEVYETALWAVDINAHIYFSLLEN